MKIIVTLCGETCAFRTRRSAFKHFARLSRAALPAALYIDGECAATYRGSRKRVNPKARALLKAGVMR